MLNQHKINYEQKLKKYQGSYEKLYKLNEEKINKKLTE